MLEYILKRIGQTIIVLFFVSVFAFSLIRMAPGNPALLMVPDGSSKEVIAAMEEKLGLKDPLPVQYFRYITGVLRGDLGDSTQYRVPVSEIVKNRLPNTAVLALVSVLAGLCIAIPLGIFAGARRGTFADFFAMFMALLGQSLSPVWLSVLLMMIFANWFGILPAMGMDSWKNLILPVATLAYPMAASLLFPLVGDAGGAAFGQDAAAPHKSVFLNKPPHNGVVRVGVDFDAADALPAEAQALVKEAPFPPVAGQPVDDAVGALVQPGPLDGLVGRVGPHAKGKGPNNAALPPDPVEDALREIPLQHLLRGPTVPPLGGVAALPHQLPGPGVDVQQLRQVLFLCCFDGHTTSPLRLVASPFAKRAGGPCANS